jgi:hypothetical protein
MEQIRRLLPRQFADWRAKCMFAEDADKQWHECRVVDVSTAGAGILLPAMTPEDVVGTGVLLAVHLSGELRNVGPGRNGGLRVGIQFADLTEEERKYLDSLAELHTAW